MTARSLLDRVEIVPTGTALMEAAAGGFIAAINATS